MKSSRYGETNSVTATATPIPMTRYLNATQNPTKSLPLRSLPNPSPNTEKSPIIKAESQRKKSERNEDARASKDRRTDMEISRKLSNKIALLWLSLLIFGICIISAGLAIFDFQALFLQASLLIFGAVLIGASFGIVMGFSLKGTRLKSHE
jgi:hypothetical protein